MEYARCVSNSIHTHVGPFNSLKENTSQFFDAGRPSRKSSSSRVTISGTLFRFCRRMYALRKEQNEDKDSSRVVLD